MAHGIPRNLGIVLGFLWGVGQHLPQQQFYVAGIGLGDVLFLGYLATTLALWWGRAPWVGALGELAQFSHLVLLFVLLVLISGVAAAFRSQMLLRDLVETLRPLYYLVMTAFVAAWTRTQGVTPLVVAFLVGVLVMAGANYLYEGPSSIVIFGFRTLNNPNVVGNVIGVSTFLSAFVVMGRRSGLGVSLLIALLIMSVFTYSKGAWLMSLLGALASLFALRNAGRFSQSPHRRLGKWVAVASLIVLGTTAYQLRTEIGLLVRFKLSTTRLGSSAAEGGTFAQRLGFLKASARMAGQRPLVGVGLSNYEREYDRLREDLAAAYHPTDNPHSAFLYVLACNGIPAFLMYLAVFGYPFVVLRRIVPERSRNAYVFAGLLVFVISGSVQIQLLSQPYFWVFVGIVSGWALRIKPETGVDSHPFPAARHLRSPVGQLSHVSGRI